MSYLKSTRSDLNGFVLMFTWWLSSCVLTSQTSGKRSLSAWNPLCLQQLFKLSLCSLHQMLSITHIPYAKHLKWEDVWNRDAHCFFWWQQHRFVQVGNTFLKLTKRDKCWNCAAHKFCWGASESHFYVFEAHSDVNLVVNY